MPGPNTNEALPATGSSLTISASASGYSGPPPTSVTVNITVGGTATDGGIDYDGLTKGPGTNAPVDEDSRSPDVIGQNKREIFLNDGPGWERAGTDNTGRIAPDPDDVEGGDWTNVLVDMRYKPYVKNGATLASADASETTAAHDVVLESTGF